MSWSQEGKPGGSMTKRTNESWQPVDTSSEKVELKGLFTMMLGVWYPTNYVLAAIDPAEGAAAVKALFSAGFGSNSVHLVDSAHVGEIRATIKEQRTPLQRAAATVSRTLTDEGLVSQQYFDEAAVGASLIAVLAPETRLLTEARQILSSYHARYIRFYGHTTIAEL